MSFDPSMNNQEEASFADWRRSEAAFEAFFKKTFPNLCVYCKFKYGFDMEMAEDVVNTSFIKLWEARPTLEADVAPRSYLYKIIHHTSLNIIKHEKVKQQHVQLVLKSAPDSVDPEGFDAVDLKQLRAAIEGAIAELPEQMRRVFELSRFEGLKYAEIAGQLSISVKTVETQMSRALARLRERLSGYLAFWAIVLVSRVL
ncbi:RNA polymerase sigma-70 factor [Paraflavisolibacter sp. H34]|uniref:RNA polymerase sigma-70 factor n=1 Tax=Huijunlia imazamoxiresistens TaxID=3127457 RepID=UPI003017ED11